MSNYIFETHKLMSEKNVNLAFSGVFTPELITSLLFMAKNNIEKRGVMRKVYNIMIECLENLTKHGQAFDNEQPAIFLLGNDQDFYYLATGNTIPVQDLENIKEKIEKTNELNRQDLRTWYNEILYNNEKLNANGGAGLGIIDIALKSGNKLDYEFRQLDSENYFFILKVKVNISKANSN